MGLVTGVFSLARGPVRVTLKAWEFGLSTAAEAARLGLELLDPGRSGGRPDLADYQAPAHPGSAGNGGAPEPEVVIPEFDEAPDAPPPVPDALIPDHVDQETVLVAESAEAGAEDGVGAELHIDPPWDGYDRMTAADIRDRLAAASPVEAAAVELYESAHKSRRTVIDAASRALKTG